MAIDKLPMLGLLTQTQGIQGKKTPPIEESHFNPPIDYSGQNLFGGGLVGVNENIGIGDSQDGPTQMGRKLGGRTIAFG